MIFLTYLVNPPQIHLVAHKISKKKDKLNPVSPADVVKNPIKIFYTIEILCSPSVTVSIHSIHVNEGGIFQEDNQYFVKKI